MKALRSDHVLRSKCYFYPTVANLEFVQLEDENTGERMSVFPVKPLCAP